MSAVVLVVDDDPVQRRLIENMVQRFGYKALTADGGDAAAKLLCGPEGERIDCVILDLVMPDLDGLGVMARMKEAGRNIPVIVQTAHGGIDNVVSAMRAGATDFVVKPAGAERIQVSLRNALATKALGNELQRLKRSREGTLSFADVITRSAIMKGVLRSAEKAAASNIPALIEGESGVGKEMIARAIHGSGDRRAKPFVAVNCGALPDNLVESILFGHEKGAFTGATEKHAGKFAEADGGTLFLDEIGELPLMAQVKLLRALQQGEIEPVGGKKNVKVNVRIISATNRNLIGRRENRPLPRGPVLPPARLSAVGAAAAFAQGGHRRAGAAFHRPLCGGGRQARQRRFSRSAHNARIARVAWQCAPARKRDLPRRRTGGRRDLGINEFPQITAQRDNSTAIVPDIPQLTMSPSALPLLKLDGDVRPLDDIEREVIRFAIAHYRGQMSEVARRLRIGRSTLYRKLESLGLEDENLNAG